MSNIAQLPGREAKQPKLDTITSVESVFVVGANQWARINPDKLSRKKGLSIYAQMREDDQVKAATQFKRDAVVSRGWTFSYDDSSKLSKDEQSNRIKVFEAILEAYPGSFVDAINGVAAGRDYGFSLTEKVFTAVDLPSGPAVGIGSLRFRDPCAGFEFVTDEYGTLKDFRQRAAGQIIELDLADFIHYVHAPEADPYFGRSDLRAAYKYWYMKGRVQDFWGQYLERLAGGFGVITATKDSSVRPGTSDYAAMRDFLANMRGAAGVMVPAGLEFKLEQASETKVFESFVQFADLAIARSMLVPNLLGASHTGQTGAYSQSQTQLESFYWTIQQDQVRLEAVLNEQLFKPLARQNFADEEGPCFGFKPLSEDRLKWLVTTWASLITGGAVVSTEEDEQFLRKLLNMPERDETSAVLVTPTEKLQRDQMAQDQKNNQTQQTAKQDAAETNKALHTALTKIEALEAKFAALEIKPVTINNQIAPPEATARNNATETGATSEGHVHVHAQPIACSKAAFTRAVQRVAFSVIEQRQMTAVETAVAETAAAVASSVDRLMTPAKVQKYLAQPETITNLKLSGQEAGTIKGTIKSALVNSYVDGVAMARNEIERGGAKVEARRTSFRSVKNVAADYLEANGFRIAGNVSDAVRSIMQQEMLNGVKAGSGITEIRTAIWNRLVAKGLTSAQAALAEESDEAVQGALNALWVDTELAAAAYLNTIVRTNIFDSFNEGRYAEFTDPALGDFVAALEYSAVLDDRTTEICQELDGSVFDTDSELWATYRPPNHYNCRSILVAITQLDVERGEWDGQESDPPGIQPQDGFGPGEKG